MKRVVVVSSIWLYSTDSKVLRWIKLCKYLKQMGYAPLLVVPAYALPDSGLAWDIADDLDQLEIYESQTLSKFVSHLKRGTKQKGLGAIFHQYITLRPVIRNLLKKLAAKYSDQPADYIITSSDNPLFHQIGKPLKEVWKSAWYIDYQLPDDEVLRALLERKTESCEGILLAGKTAYSQLLGHGRNEVHYIPNGFDAIPLVKETDSKFSIVYVGSMDTERIPGQLFGVLKDLKESEPGFADDLQLQFYGSVDESIVEIIHEQGLQTNFKHSAFVNHAEAISHQCQAQVLLLVIERTSTAAQVTTFKIFEYLIACRPILGIGPLSGEAAQIIHDTQSGRMFHYKEYRELKEQLKSYYHEYKNRELVVRSRGVRRYHFRNSAKALAEVLG